MASSFDPNQFLKDTQAKQNSGFDPNSFLAKINPQLQVSIPEGQMGEAALQGFGQGASLGYLPQLQGATEVGLDKVSKILGIGPYAADQQLQAQGFQINQQRPTYVSARDERIKALSNLQKAEPTASMLGEIGGAITGGVPLAAALPVAEGAGLAGRALQAGKAGALIGGLQAPESTPGKIEPLQLGERAKNAALGGALGGVTQVGLEGANKVFDVAAKGIGKLYTKIASMTSGVSPTTINTYASSQKEIDQLAKKYGGDFSQYADDIRSQLSQKIQESKNKLGAQISKELDKLPQQASIDSQNIVNSLDSVKSRLNPKLYPEARAQIEELQSKIQSVSDNGKLTPQLLNEVKGFLQDTAKPAYLKGGQIFQNAKDTQIAAKQGARVAKQMLDQVAPEVKEINSRLSKLHQIEGNLNRNLLAAGKPEGSLVAAGTGANPRAALQLKALGNQAGVDILPEVQKFAAGRTFASPEALPAIETGKALARSALGAGIGSYASDNSPYGVGAGALLGSPLGVKQTIRALNLARQANPQLLSRIIQSPAFLQPLLQQRLKALEE